MIICSKFLVLHLLPLCFKKRSTSLKRPIASRMVNILQWKWVAWTGNFICFPKMGGKLMSVKWFGCCKQKCSDTLTAISRKSKISGQILYIHKWRNSNFYYCKTNFAISPFVAELLQLHCNIAHLLKADNFVYSKLPSLFP